MLKHPTDLHADLTPERLAAIAQILADVRDGTQRDARRELGDRAWGTGCRSYERTCFALRAFAKENSDWLTTVTKGQQFEMRIGCVPVRFCRDDADRPSKRHTTPSPGEARSLRGLFSEEWVGVLRFVLETDRKGFPERVVFQHVDERDEPFDAWDVWAAAAGVGTDPGAPQPVEQAPPVVRTIDSAEDRRAAAGE